MDKRNEEEASIDNGVAVIVTSLKTPKGDFVSMDLSTIGNNVRELAGVFGQERPARQLRRALDPADFARLRDAGFLLTGVSVENGGAWHDAQRSTRAVADMLRTLAHADSSLALVCSMHPSVLLSAGWLGLPEAPPPFRKAWTDQREQVFHIVRDGAWWGTLVSEPGTGGNVAATKVVARRDFDEGNYRLTGLKHFGSGLGVTSYMIATALPNGEHEPSLFFVKVRDLPWDGSAGLKVVAEWDGHGMTATQSHTVMFTNMPATRSAWPEYGNHPTASGGSVHCFWTGVIVGIVETALETARKQLESRRTSLRAFEQVEWSRAEVDAWLIEQAYEGMLRAVENLDRPGAAGASALKGKIAVAELAESTLSRICRVVGGGAYSRRSPFGFWLEDVRALGFLRPPWGLAYETLFNLSQ